MVLTLKDSKVLGEDGEYLCSWYRPELMTSEDELQNVNMVESEALKAAKDRKRKAQEQYTGYDDDEFEEGRIGKKAEILAKYDDEFSTGKVKTEVCRFFGLITQGLIMQGFRLGAPVQEKKIVLDEDTEMIGQAPAQKVKLNLDYASEYLYLCDGAG